MKFGRFDDASKEYVISTPQTPYPWINYLGTDSFFSLISNTAGGYCFYKDARLRRITRYRYNNVPLDNNGRYFYIRDGDDYWSPGWKPVRADLDSYECRHGIGYTVITGMRNGIRVEVLFFVPLGDNVEIHRASVTNHTNRAKTIRLFSCVEFCLWDALDDMTNFQRNYSISEVEVEGSTIYHTTEYRERRNHYSFYSVNHHIDSYDTERDAFVGLYGDYDSPGAVKAGRCSNSIVNSWSPVAAQCIEISLEPGEKRDIIFLLGYIENDPQDKWESPGVINKAKAHDLIARYSTTEQVDWAFERLRAYWDDLLSYYTVESPDERLDRMVNIWNQYQCMVTFNMSRSASYFESGIGRGIGFRDSNQDILGFVHQAPDKARDRILDLAATQLEDGGAYHQYQPLTKKGNNDIGGNFNDDPLWLILSTSAYIKETGDWSILDENVQFDNDPSKAASIFEHLRRSFYHVTDNLGPHGLPLIGRADWNDCLNLNCFSSTPGESFQTCTNRDGKVAESVLIAGMFVHIGPEFVAMCTHMGLMDEASAAEARIRTLEEAVLRWGYDGDWFLRAYDGSGNKVGSADCEEGKIFLEPQGFCVMAGIGIRTGHAAKALDSVRKYLDTQHGLVLLSPAYTRYHINLGEVSSYPPGYKENAGIFCHSNPWIMIAETRLGRGDRAFEYYSKIAPAYREDISEVHRMEPYVYSQMIAGKDAKRHGEAKNSWLTGTAAWNFVAISQWILGVRPDYDGLLVDPCIPRAWRQYTVTRKFRSASYRITINNPLGVSRGIKKVVVDGIESRVRDDGSVLLPVFGDERLHEVEVVLG